MTSRERFEAWWATKFVGLKERYRDSFKEYWELWQWEYWNAWQARDQEILEFKKYAKIVSFADSELSAIAHGRPPSDKCELLELSRNLRDLAELLK